MKRAEETCDCISCINCIAPFRSSAAFASGQPASTTKSKLPVRKMSLKKPVDKKPR